ncbi:DinB family protein [Litoribacter populi]|uniref:DinB family protein n=1 Tax=Litoribacter populi TaxID=2598460 RepID=UPI00117D84DA|nr:DinB family protein [Litoribacter populi]
METKQKLISQFKRVSDELLRLLSSLSSEDLNATPITKGWSAGQIGEHLYNSYAVVETLNGSVKKTERPPAEKVEKIETLFLDFDIKMKSPEAILPREDYIEKEWLLDSLKERIDQLKAVIMHKDLTETCLDVIIPEYGEFTRLEWTHFNIVHTQRHIHQLKNIIKNHPYATY